MKKEWEDSIVASKKVKREEMRRKLKRAMLILLVFSLITTSVVYVMLLFVQENNIRITASNRNKEKSISLSMDNDFWTPYLNADGPEHMWNISYDVRYKTEQLDTIAKVAEMLEADEVQLGTQNGEQFIRFVFMLKNTGNEAAHINYEMTLEFDKHKLHDAVRVMWGQSFKNETVELEKNTDVEIYAALSKTSVLPAPTSTPKATALSARQKRASSSMLPIRATLPHRFTRATSIITSRIMNPRLTSTSVLTIWQTAFLPRRRSFRTNMYSNAKRTWQKATSCIVTSASGLRGVTLNVSMTDWEVIARLA